MHELDELDRALLREWQRDCRQSSQQLSQRIALSPTAIQRRLKRLRDSGVIVAEQALLDPERVGRPLTIIVLVSMARGRSAHIDEFKRRCLGMAEVQQCYYVTGEQDFVVLLSVRDMAQYEALTQKLFLSDPVFEKFQTLVVMDRVKTGLTLPLS